MASPTQVTFEIDFEEMFGEPIPDDSDLRGRISQAVMDRIQERTQSGIDREGNPFAPYSEEYAKKKGVSPDAVDLTLFGDMLASIDEVARGAQSVTLGFPDVHENAKAFNHTTGDTVPKRDFFGLPVDELRSIAAEFEDEVRRLRSDDEDQVDENRERDEELREIIRGIIAGDFDDEFGL